MLAKALLVNALSGNLVKWRQQCALATGSSLRKAPPALPERKTAAKQASGSSLADFMDKMGGNGGRLSRVQHIARPARSHPQWASG